MIKINIPGSGVLELQSLVLDFNGTIATDGKLIAGVKERLERLSADLNIYVLTADTNGTVHTECRELPVTVHVIGAYQQAEEKAKFLEQIQGSVAVVGNGRNDEQMFAKAALAIAVLGDEGCSSKTLLTSDLITRHINDSLELLINKNRLIATLRR